MANTYWRRARGGTSGHRVFAAYLALVLMVAMVGPGLAVYAAEGEAPVEPEPVVEAPIVEAPIVEAPIVEEPVAEPALEPEPAPLVAAVVASVEAPLTPVAAAESIAVATPPITDENDSSWICAGGVKLDSNPRSGTYIPSTPNTEETLTTPSDYSITITTYDTAAGMKMDFVSNYPVTYVKVKGSDGATFYTYDPPVYSATGLHAPIAGGSGTYADISHIVFCFGTPSTDVSIVVTKFHDDGPDTEKANGTHDSDAEEWLGGFAFELYSGPDADGPWTYVETVSSVLPDGKADFGIHPLGWYKIVEVLSAEQIAAGWYATTTGGVKIFEATATSNDGLYIGNLQEEVVPPETGNLVIHKFEDLNEDGIHDPGEPALENWEFTVTLESPPLQEDIGPAALIGSGFTNASGEITFSELLPDVYTVTETLQDGWENSTPLVREVEVVAGETAHVWFGNFEPSLPFTELDLAITKVVDDRSVVEGQLLTYTLTYWNNGDIPAEGYSIVDDYDERYLSIVDAAGGVVAGGKITWMPAGALAKADGKKTITYTARVIADMPDATTNIDNVVVISHPRDSDPTNNTDNERVVYTPVSEPFLPFTGGEYVLLLGFAVAAAAIGLLLRLRTDSAA